MTYQVKFVLHPDGPYVERDEGSLLHDLKAGNITPDTMLRRHENDPWLPIRTALHLPEPPAEDLSAIRAESKCPKCQGQMLAGFIPDFTHSGAVPSSWYKGEPMKSFWGGLRVSFGAGLPIRAFRCSHCGYLELYANRGFKVK